MTKRSELRDAKTKPVSSPLVPLFPEGTRSRAESERLDAYIRDRLGCAAKPNLIASETGLSRNTIYNRIFRMRAAGELPKFEPKATMTRVQGILDKRGISLGRADAIFSNMTLEAGQWLANCVPEGVTLYEFIGALVIDAYQDDLEEKMRKRAGK
jgi:hypothetical protein